MTTTDVMLLGWLSPRALAAGALGYNLYMPLFLFCVGVIGAVAPIAASLVGADPGDAAGLRRACHQALLSAFVLALPAWAILWNAKAILLAIGEPPDLAAQAGLYMHGLQWALAPALLYFAARSVFAALGRTAPTLIAGLLAVVFNAGANYALIFGHFGAPAWGVFGSGVATSLSQSAHAARARLLFPRRSAFAPLSAVPRPLAAGLARLRPPVAPRPADRRDDRGGDLDLRRGGAGDGADRPRFARGACDRAADRLDRVHGSARPRPGRERARRPRLRRARRVARRARRLDRVFRHHGLCRALRLDDARGAAAAHPALPRRATRRKTPKSSRWRFPSCASPRFSRSSTARRPRSPTCCAASTTRAGR